MSLYDVTSHVFSVKQKSHRRSQGSEGNVLLNILCFSELVPGGADGCLIRSVLTFALHHLGQPVRQEEQVLIPLSVFISFIYLRTVHIKGVV